MDEKDLLIAQLRKENAALRQMIEDLQKQVKNLTEAVLLLRKNRFGSKSVQSADSVGRFCGAKRTRCGASGLI